MISPEDLAKYIAVMKESGALQVKLGEGCEITLMPNQPEMMQRDSLTAPDDYEDVAFAATEGVPDRNLKVPNGSS